MKKPDYENVLYDFSERFYDLRHEPNQIKENGKKKSFVEISKEIEQRTDNKVHISHTQLAKYYKMSLDIEDDEEGVTLAPNVMSIIALADYYNVSLEYLLGLSDTKNSENKYKVGSEDFGLSDMSMDILEQFKNEPHIFNVPSSNNDDYKKFSGADFINFIFDNLLHNFTYLCNKYLYEVQELDTLRKVNKSVVIDYANVKVSLQNMDTVQKELKRQEDMVKYRAFQISELIIDFLKMLASEVKNRENEKETD